MKPELGAAMEYPAGMPVLIEAQPALRRGEVAVWDLVDIPLGIRRGLSTPRVSEAIEPFFMEGVQQHHQKWTNRGYYAAVAWADLQPYGATRVDASMWCDDMVQHQSTKPLRTVEDIIAEIYGMPPYSGPEYKHGRNQTGEAGPCEPDCRKCALEAELKAAGGVPMKPPPSKPAKPARTAESLIDAEAITVALMGAGSGEDFDRSGLSDEDRAAWAKELRYRVRAGEQRERGKIKVDLEFEEWE